MGEPDSSDPPTGELIIVTGPPGAGKSTVAAMAARTFDRGVHLHTDDFFGAIVSGAIAPHEPASDRQNQVVLTVIADAAFDYCDGGFTTVLDGIVGPWMLHHVAARAARSPLVPVHYLVLRPDRHTTLARAQGRTEQDALTDAGPITAMWDQFSDLGELERHVVDNSGYTAAQTVQAVLESVRARTRLLPATSPGPSGR